MPLTRVGKWSVIYGIVAVEVAVLMGSYRVWHKMNISQGKKTPILINYVDHNYSTTVYSIIIIMYLEYRKQMYQNYPSVLEGNY